MRWASRSRSTPISTGPRSAWLLFAVLIGWSAACAVAYLQGFGRRRAWVLAEIVGGGRADAVHRVRRLRAVGAEQPVVADDAVGHQRDDLGGDPARPDLRHARRRGGGHRPARSPRACSTTTSAATRRWSSSSRSGLAVGMAAQTARRAHAELERAARLAARTEDANGCPARCTTARSRCSRWCPGAAAKSAARQRNWPSWPASRNARCAAWSVRRMPNRGRER